MKSSKSFQVLRGIFCIFICLNHCGYFNKYGFGKNGVEYFVVLSGMLTAMNAPSEGHLRKHYLKSKILKLMPLYWVASIVVFFTGHFAPELFSSMTFDTSTLLYSLFLIPGHKFLIYPGWTLTYFFMFYIIYWISDIFSKKRDVICVSSIILIVISGAIVQFFMGENMFTDYANPILLEFAYGIGIFYIWKQFGHKIEAILHKNSADAVIGTLLFVVLFFDGGKYLGPRYLYPALLASVSILCMCCLTYESKFSSFVAWIGNLSYIIYIIHPLIIRPIDKIAIKYLQTDCSVWYFVSVIFSITLVVISSYILQKVSIFLKKNYKNIAQQ